VNGQRPHRYKIWTMWETEPRTIPHKIFRLLVGPEQVKRPEILEGILLSPPWLLLLLLLIVTNLRHWTVVLRSTPPSHSFLPSTHQTNRLIYLYLFPVCGVVLGPLNPWRWRRCVFFQNIQKHPTKRLFIFVLSIPLCYVKFRNYALSNTTHWILIHYNLYFLHW
jgi:hypothetical protein